MLKHYPLALLAFITACGTGSLRLNQQAAQVASVVVTDPAAPDGVFPTDPTPAPPGTDPNKAANPDTGNSDTTGNPNTGMGEPNARVVYACPVLGTCVVLGETSVASIQAAAVNVKVPATAAPAGEVFYAAVVSNGNQGVHMVRRGAVNDGGALIEFPQLLPLLKPGQTTAVDSFKVYVWSASTPVVATDLAPLVLRGSESPAVKWGFVKNPSSGQVHAVKAVLEYASMQPAIAPFQLTQYQGPATFSAHVELVSNAEGNPGSSGLVSNPAGMLIVDQDGLLVYSNIKTGGGLQSDSVLLPGKGYTIQLFSLSGLNLIGAGSDPNDAVLTRVLLQAHGDVQLFSRLGSSIAFYQQ